MSISTPATLISARNAGAIYLAIIGLGLFGELFVRGVLVVSGDAIATASNIAGAHTLWRAGIVTDLLMHVLDVPLIIFFYLLLKPVNSQLALLATVFNIVQTCVLAVNKLTLVAALYLAISPRHTAASFSEHDLALQAINLHAHGFGIGLIFFGFACVVRGYLFFQSGHVPRFIGALLIAAGISYLVNSVALLLAPPLAKLLFPAILLPALVAELALSLWLLFTNGPALQEWVKTPTSCSAPSSDA